MTTSSRLPVEEALSLLLRLVNLGVIVVTLMDGNIYRKGELDTTKLMYSLFIMSRAFEESEVKSKRLADVWAAKRKLATNKPMGANLPAWLDYNEDKTEIIINKEKAAVVLLIFKLSASGLGRAVITRKLTELGVPPIGKRAKVWHSSYMNKLLNGRTAMGEYQPHKYNADGVRVPIGDVIENYCELTAA